MLHTQTVDPSTLELLISLQKKDYLKGFHLAGGTALALYLGHRLSVDIDLFSNYEFDTERMIESIQQDYPLQLLFTAPNTIKGFIDDVNVDLITHRYVFLRDPVEMNGVRLFSVPDILAMKLNAISVSGQRSKDFIDIYYALKKYNVREMLSFYQQKYNQQGDMHVLKSLIYFDDVDLADWPVLIADPSLKWEDVKRKIEKEVLQFVSGHSNR